jgi:hypothetical protein
MRVSLNLTGGDYQHKSRDLSKQVTRNFWPQIQQPNQKARSPYVLVPFYGLKPFVTRSGGADRGMFVNQGILYKVSGTSLFTVASDGTHTDRGTIPGSGRCIFAAVGSQVVITNGAGLVYIWNGTTLVQNTSPNLGTPNSVAVLNSQAIYDAGTGQGFDVSDVGLPGTINGLNNASAESNSDDLLRVYTYRDTLYLMGRETIELWWNSGTGNPPFDKIQGGVLNIGVGAIHSVAETPDYVFILGSDNQVHSITGGTSAVSVPISTPELTAIIAKYTNKSDAIGFTFQLQGQWFYKLTFPTENITWVYPVGGEWFQWGAGTQGRAIANSSVTVFGKVLVADYASANIYELASETYTDNGNAIIRTRDSAVIHSEIFGVPNKEFELVSMELNLETGVGLVSGQGSDPLIAISFSKDNGKTFGTERFLRCGKLGERVTVMTTGLGRYKNLVIRLRVSDPIYWAIFSASIDMDICI